MSVAILQGGTRLGAYIILNSVARGGMGTVYHARHIVTNREVALKVLHPGYATDDFIARFRREAQTAGRLKHPNIIEVFDASQADGYYFIAMEYLPSGSVQRLITTFREQRQSAPLHLALAITRQIASALAFAHKKGFVHRDIKPSNILLDGNTRAVLSDFGIVFVDTATKLTLSTAMIGTPAYMSPEQGTGKPIDGRSDLYSLGVVLYELLTGATPFVANEPAAVIYMHVHEPAPSITNVRPDVPADARRILDALLAKKPDDRFANGEALIAAIDSVAPPTSSPASLGMPTSNRRKASMLALGAGGTAIALLGVGALIFTRPTPGIIAVPISTAPRPNATNTLVPRATAAGAGVVTPTVTVVITTTPPQTVTATPKPTNTPSPTATSTPQPTATVVPTATPTPTKTATRRPRPTATVTKTAATPTSSPPAEAPTSAPAQNTGGGSSNNGGGSGGGSQQPQPVQPTAAPQPTQAPAPAPTDVPQPTQASAPASTSTPQPPPP